MNVRTKKGLKIAGYGTAGNITGSLVGLGLGLKPHTIGHLSAAGSTAGLAVGAWRESKKQTVPSHPTGKGKEFQKRVGTKTQGRVSKKDHPFRAHG